MTLRLMLNTSASEPATMTSFSASLGTWTYRVSPGLASVGLKVMRFTVRSAFMAPRTFSECEGSRLGGTAMVYNVFSKLICILVMAEGGYDPMDETTDKTPFIPKKGDDNDDDDDIWKNTNWEAPVDVDPEDLDPEPEPDKRNPFEPAASSTPSDSERIALKTRTRLSPEKQGTSDETCFSTGFDSGAKTIDSMVRSELENEFPNISLTEIEFRYVKAPQSGGAVIEVRYHTSDKWYRLFTQSKGDDQKTLNTALPKRISQAIGKSTTEIINETNTTLKTLKQQEKAEEKQLRQTQSAAEEAQHLKQEMSVIRNRMQDTANQIQEIENAGPFDSDVIQKLKDEKKKLEKEHQTKRKELNTLAKTADQARKLQQELNKTRLRKGETERRLGELKARKDDSQPLDKLKQRAEELNQNITEDIRLIENENTSPSEREAARERLAVRNEELETVNEEIEARERQRPLLERVKDIFKKYGWTLQAVALAVGIVLSALALAATNGLKAGTKAIGNGLKTMGQKLGSLLPGLIGSIVSYIFKAAGQVFSFLAEHAWLLILAVVAFFMERLLKKRRR